MTWAIAVKYVLSPLTPQRFPPLCPRSQSGIDQLLALPPPPCRQQMPETGDIQRAHHHPARAAPHHVAVDFEGRIEIRVRIRNVRIEEPAFAHRLSRVPVPPLWRNPDLSEQPLVQHVFQVPVPYTGQRLTQSPEPGAAIMVHRAGFDVRIEIVERIPGPGRPRRTPSVRLRPGGTLTALRPLVSQFHGEAPLVGTLLSSDR